MGNTSIEWTDRTWNPVRGCSRVSEGCRNCYAEGQAARFVFQNVAGEGGELQKPGPFHQFVTKTNGHPQWTGKVELIEKHLTDPLHWRKPQRVFVNSMSDLFHEALPDEAIDRVFAVMALCPQHTFQILTKRPKRMLEWTQGFEEMRHESARDAMVEGATQALYARLHPKESDCSLWLSVHQPLPNVWLGVSVEDQKTADERIPLLLQTPAAVRFVSYEPALGPVDFTALPSASGIGRFLDALSNAGVDAGALVPHKLDWVIVGGESGPGARPFDIAWARETIEQCKAAGVACFVKQLGAHPFSGHSLHKQIHHRSTDGNLYLKLKDRKGGDISEWPKDLRVREFPR